MLNNGDSVDSGYWREISKDHHNDVKIAEEKGWEIMYRVVENNGKYYSLRPESKEN